MSLNQDPFLSGLGQIEQYISETAALDGDLKSYRSGMQFTLFTIVSALRLSPGFDVSIMREFARTALDNPPPGFENNPLFHEPLALLMGLTSESAAT